MLINTLVTILIIAIIIVTVIAIITMRQWKIVKQAYHNTKEYHSEVEAFSAYVTDSMSELRQQTETIIKEREIKYQDYIKGFISFCDSIEELKDVIAELDVENNDPIAKIVLETLQYIEPLNHDLRSYITDQEISSFTDTTKEKK